MSCRSCDEIDRRDFLRFALGGTAAAAFAPHLLAQETRTVRRAKSCILLWMSGGPSQLDTFDPKPGRKTGGPTKAIDTAVRGMQISQYLPRLAKQAKHLSIIRSLTTEEPEHGRGTHLMHTGYSPIEGLPFAPLGTVVSHERTSADYALPTYIALSAPEIPQSPIFGETHLPFVVENLDNPIPHLQSPAGQDRDRQRAALVEEQDRHFGENHEGRAMERRVESSKKAHELMSTPLLEAFRIHKEPDAKRKAYGDGFGKRCLLARRLVQAGVPFVEIGMGGWDTHDNNFDQVKNLCGPLDRGFATLLEDLDQTDLLKDTLVIWAGEFGRTPQINGGNGRDHWTRCWSVALAGGGIQGGRVIGSTDQDGMDLQNRPVPVQDLFATLYHCLGIDHKKQYVLSTRKVKYAFNGTVVKELL